MSMEENKVIIPAELAKYNVLEDMTKNARNGKYAKLTGRTEEIRRVIEILSRINKCNPIILGEPGVGKTAIVEGVAQKIANNDVPPILKGKYLYAIDIEGLKANASLVGQLEARVLALVNFAKKYSDKCIFFIDEIHTLMSDTANYLDIPEMLKSVLARGEMKCIGASTLKEYTRSIERKNPALARRFQKVPVEEPSRDVTISILRTAKQKMEEAHNVKIKDSAIEAAVDLSIRYIANQFLPDKALTLLDTSAARLSIEAYDSEKQDLLVNRILQINTEIKGLKKEYSDDAREKITLLTNEYNELENKLKALDEIKNKERVLEQIVDENSIAKEVAKQTGIDVNKMFSSDKEKALHLKDEMAKIIVGQDKALDLVYKSVLKFKAGIQDEERPLGSFLFLGPTGVGKTEVAKTLADQLFDSKKNMIRIDMSEYESKEKINNLIGSPKGYIGNEDGGILTNAVRRNPYSIVLFDEIEKAHKDIFNILLQILDEGTLTDSDGLTVNFKNTIIILTSNIGSKNATIENDEKRQEAYKKALYEFLKLEIINRIDNVVIFNRLTNESFIKIIDKFIDVLAKRIKKNVKANLIVTDKTKEHILKEGIDINLGARPIRRYIQNYIEPEISRIILENDDVKGKTFIVDVVDDQIVVTI